jgi:thiol-disulfide isomerase/thioredoxin
VAENYGESALARRFGVTRYPAIFVGDVLVATPKDFGFYGKGEGAKDGRYAPLKSAASHDRFRGDLKKMVELLLSGRADEARARATPVETPEIASLPSFTLTDLEGRAVSREDLSGRVVLVEFWATWCPPCRATLAWLGELKKRYGERIVVLAVAVESDEAGVRAMASEMGLPLRFAMGNADLARSFGDLSAVPTLFLFDRAGRRVETFYGAPPSLHAQAEARLQVALKP